MKDLWRVLQLGRHHRGRLALAGVAGGLTAVCGAGLLATSAFLISRAALRPPILALTTTIVLVRAFAVGRAALRYGERVVSHDTSLRLLADLRGWFYERLRTVAPGGLQAFRSGDVLARMVGDVEGLQDFFIRILGALLAGAFTAALLVPLTWAILPLAAVVIGLSMVLGGAAAGFLARLAAPSSRQVSVARAALASDLVEDLEGAAELLVFDGAGRRLERLRAIDSRVRRQERWQASAAGAGRALAVLLPGATVCLVLAVAVPAVRTGALQGPLLGAVALLPLAGLEVVAALPGAFQQLESHRQAARRLFEITDTATRTREPSVPTPSPTPLPGPLALERARLRYEGRRDWALDGVDLRVEPGRPVALVGPSGAGKTTVANVLVRFRDLDRGRVVLNGRDLRDYRSEDVRRVIGLVTQEPHLFNTSILENVRLARPDAGPDEVDAAAARARLPLWVRSLPEGWQTRVGERGTLVSGGQRQRIALARALLAGFPILVLDEPLAQLDPEMALALMEDLLAIAVDRSLLLITHRLCAMERMAEIAVLDAGRIVERGTHDQLMDLDRLYRRMWRLQHGV